MGRACGHDWGRKDLWGRLGREGRARGKSWITLRINRGRCVDLNPAYQSIYAHSVFVLGMSILAPYHHGE